MTAFAVLGLAGWSGSGKTTFLEKLIPALAQRGVDCAVIKHDVHGLSRTDRGKDSRRLLDAGAVQCILCAPNGPVQTLPEALKLVKNVRLCLVEGFKGASIPQLGLARAANGKDFTAHWSRFRALVTDMPPADAAIPCFAPEDAAGAADFILAQLDSLRLPDSAQWEEKIC